MTPAFRSPHSARSFALVVSMLMVAGALFVGWTGVASADPQLTGTLNIPGDYPTLADAITALNAQGVDTGGVTLNLVAGNPQTAPAGGYVIGGAGSLVLSTTSSGNPVTIQGNGNTITAPTPQTAGNLNNAIFKLIGADWIMITGFTMQENPANTTTAPATNNMTEWGVALLHVSTTDGAQNNTIQGNTISLNRNYTNTWGVYANNRHSATVVGTAEDVTNNTAGPNSGNKVYGNTISNVNMGIAFIGTSAAANQDVGNDVGGSSAGTGNTLSNWGGAGAASTYISNSGTSYCIFMNHQTADNVSYNTLTSAAVSGTSVTFRGIFKGYTTTAPTGTFTSSITNNSITMTSGFLSGTFEGIRSQELTTLSTATININYNTILNCAVTGAASSSAIVGIVNSSAPGTLSMSNNIIQGTTSTATTGGFTGVSNTGAVVTTINLNNNQIGGGGGGGGAITFSAATSGAVLGVSNGGGASTAALSMSGNDFRGITHSVPGTSAHTYVSNTAATLSQNISSNTFTNLNVNTTGNVRFMQNDVALPSGGSVTANSNSIVTAFNKGAAGGTVTLYHTSGGPSSLVGTTKSEQYNNFSNITLTGATTMAGWIDLEGATGGGSTKTIANNTFTNWACGSSAVTVIQTGYSGNGSSVSGNTIANISGTGGITGVSIGTTNGGAAQTVASNTISMLTSSGTGGTVLGITGGSSSITALTISGNTINGLSSTYATGLVSGITVSAGATVNVFKNKIYDLLESGATTLLAVNGILASSGTTVNVYNNLVGDLRATAANNADAIRGLSVTSSTTLSSYNLSYNTVDLYATSSGATFGTTGIYHTTNATATTAALNLRDNIIVNNSTPNGTGLAVAYRRSSTTLTNYASTSNNNLFYAGAPGASRLIFYDGTNADATLAAFQARVTPREANSITENPPFLSVIGSSPNFLHIDPAIATQIESAGQPVAGITDDYDSQVRHATTPDIGADEGTFTLADFSGPLIAYTPLGNSSSTTTQSFANVTVSDPSGVNGTAGTRPRVYYKKSTDANTFVDSTSTTNGWKYVEASGPGSPFAFTIDYSLLFSSPVVGGDVIQYFVVAQDLAAPPNVGINSGTFATQPASVNLAAANFPIGGTIRSFTIVDVPLSGDYTVGAALFNRMTGADLTFERRVQRVTREVLEPADPVPQMSGDKSSSEVFLADQVDWNKVSREVEEVTWVPMSNGREFKGPLYVKRAENTDLPAEARAGVYATITAAVADLNARGVSGPVRFLLTDATYPAETFPITVNVLNAAVPTATNTVTIKPDSSVTASVSGAGASTAIFKVFNTNYITIDGSNAESGTTRDLTIENTSVTSPNVVWFGSSGTTPITNGMLKNCIVRNGVNTSSAVVISDGATMGSAGYFSNMGIANNRIEKAYIGVYSTGGTVPAYGAGLTYADNQLTTSGTNAIRLVGLYMQGVNGATVSGNTVANIEGTTAENDIGIWLASGTINATVSGNSVSNLGYTGTSSYAPIGINVTPGVAGANANVTGNTVTAISTAGTSPARGIASPTAGTADIVIQRNNVQGVTNTNTGTYGAYGIDVTAGNNHTIKNNFVSDVRFDMTGGAAFSTTFGVFGIRIGSGTGHVVADNSVNLFGTMLGTSYSSLLSAALCVVGTTSTGCDIRNNILSNKLTGGTTSIAHVSVYLPSGGTSAMTLTWNNNAYYSGTDTATQGIAQVGATAGTGFYLAGDFNPGATTPATNLRAYTSTLSAAGTNDNASMASTAAAPYIGNTNLHINTSGIPVAPVANAGVTIAGITDDYDGDLRSATPDIGADEFASYTLATSVIGGGSVLIDPDQPLYNPGTQVQLTAAARGWVFDYWTGDATGSDNPVTITMDGDKDVTAHFRFATALAIADAALDEGNSGTANMLFTVTLAEASPDTVSVEYATADSTATVADNDYTAAADTLVFLPGDTEETLAVPIVGDLLNEMEEVFHVRLTHPLNASMSDSLGRGVILNDDPLPTLAVDDIQVTEGNAGTVPATFTVTLSAPSGQAVSAKYATADGTAHADTDYVALPLTEFTFNPGDSLTKHVTVLVNGDLLDEPDETLQLDLTQPVNATLGDSVGLCTIFDDDVYYELTVEVAGGGSVTVDPDQTLFLAGTTVRLTAVQNRGWFFDHWSGDATGSENPIDIVMDGDRHIIAHFAFTTGIAIADAVLDEGGSGTTNALFTVTLAEASPDTVRAAYATADSSALLADSDYLSTTGTVVFLPGDTEETIAVPVVGDLRNELDEVFKVTLSAPVHGTIGDALGLGTIRNDDPLPSISIADVAAPEGDSGTTPFDFLVTLSAASGRVVSVKYATADGSALAGEDYTALPLTELVFAPGDPLTKTVTVMVNGDTDVEPDEIFYVNLTEPANATISDAQAAGTIQSEELPPPTGACCLASYVCQIMTEAECDAAGGAYRGDETDCDPNPCLPLEIREDMALAYFDDFARSFPADYEGWILQLVERWMEPAGPAQVRDYAPFAPEQWTDASQYPLEPGADATGNGQGAFMVGMRLEGEYDTVTGHQWSDAAIVQSEDLYTHTQNGWPTGYEQHPDYPGPWPFGHYGAIGAVGPEDGTLRMRVYNPGFHHANDPVEGAMFTRSGPAGTQATEDPIGLEHGWNVLDFPIADIFDRYAVGDLGVKVSSRHHVWGDLVVDAVSLGNAPFEQRCIYLTPDVAWFSEAPGYETKTVSLYYDDGGGAAPGVRGFSVELHYPIGCAQVTQVVRGDFLSATGQPTHFEYEDEGDGTLTIDWAILGLTDGATGFGKLATITFAATSPTLDCCDLVTFNTVQCRFRDPNNVPITNLVFAGGKVSHDITPPEASVLTSPTHASGTPTFDDDLKLTWPTTSDGDPGVGHCPVGMRGYYLLLDHSPTGAPDPSGAYSWFTPWSPDSLGYAVWFEDLPEGTWYAHVIGYDWLWNASPVAHYGPIPIDKTAPAMVTGFDADITDEADRSVDLAWTNPGDADFAGVEIYRIGTAGTLGSTYPEYDDHANWSIPAWPATRAAALVAGWTLIGQYPGTSTIDLPAERDYEHYVAFAYDNAGNYSGAGAGSHDASLCYWLGDFNGTKDPDFFVDLMDVLVLSLAYNTAEGETEYNPVCDIGPTSDWGRKSLPTTDNEIEFEDLIMLALNYEYAQGRGAIAPPPNPCSGAMQARLVRNLSGNELEVSIMLSENPGCLKGASVTLAFGDGLEYLGAAAGEIWPGADSRFFQGARGGVVTLDAVALGGVTAQNGSHAIVRFRVTDMIGDRTVAIDEFRARGPENVDLAGGSSSEVGIEALPTTHALFAAMPNPATRSTTIGFALASETRVQIRLYDAAGRLVRGLVDEPQPAGYYQVAWDGLRDDGSPTGPGIYFCRMQAGSFVASRKLTMIR